MFIFFFLIFGKDCEIQKDGLVLVEYYKKENALHQLMEPLVDVVSRGSVKVQKIDCGICECKGVDEFPTFRLIKDESLLDSFTGFKPYGKLMEFISQGSKDTSNTKDTTKDSKNTIKDDHTRLVELEERDFYSGFDGPWLVLFYYHPSEEIDSLLKQVHDALGGRVMVGKIKYSESKYLESRFHIRAYPTVFGMYNSLNVPFLDVLNFHNLMKFTNKLIEPSFKSIDYPQLLTLSKDKDPIYIVLNKNESKANDSFFKYSHNFKFKIRMFKSQDPRLFEKAGVFPSEDEALVVYKNGSYFVYDGNISDENSIVEWIFHTHFPNVTRISNASFHSIFNGLKPVFLLLTDHEEFLDHLESFSRDVHLGKPYLHILFSSINLQEYMLFTASLLPEIQIPTFVIYNPLDKKFYHRKAHLTPETFRKEAEEILKMFEKGTLKPYERKESHLYLWMLFCGLIVGGVCYFVRSKSLRVI